MPSLLSSFGVNTPRGSSVMNNGDLNGSSTASRQTNSHNTGNSLTSANKTNQTGGYGLSTSYQNKTGFTPVNKPSTFTMPAASSARIDTSKYMNRNASANTLNSGTSSRVNTSVNSNSYKDILNKGRQVQAANMQTKYEAHKAKQQAQRDKDTRLRQAFYDASHRAGQTSRAGIDDNAAKLLQEIEKNQRAQMESHMLDEVRESVYEKYDEISEAFKHEIKEKTRTRLIEELEPVVKAELMAKHESEVRDELRAELKDEVVGDLKSLYKSQVKEQLFKELENDVRMNLREALRQTVYNDLRNELGPRVQDSVDRDEQIKDEEEGHENIKTEYVDHSAIATNIGPHDENAAISRPEYDDHSDVVFNHGLPDGNSVTSRLESEEHSNLVSNNGLSNENSATSHLESSMDRARPDNLKRLRDEEDAENVEDESPRSKKPRYETDDQNALPLEADLGSGSNSKSTAYFDLTEEEDDPPANNDNGIAENTFNQYRIQEIYEDPTYLHETDAFAHYDGVDTFDDTQGIHETVEHDETLKFENQGVMYPDLAGDHLDNSHGFRSEYEGTPEGSYPDGHGGFEQEVGAQDEFINRDQINGYTQEYLEDRDPGHVRALKRSFSAEDGEDEEPNLHNIKRYREESYEASQDDHITESHGMNGLQEDYSEHYDEDEESQEDEEDDEESFDEGFDEYDEEEGYSEEDPESVESQAAPVIRAANTQDTAILIDDDSDDDEQTTTPEDEQTLVEGEGVIAHDQQFKLKPLDDVEGSKEDSLFLPS